MLGLSQRSSASKEDIMAAFRRELVKYHPDHARDSGYSMADCNERTRMIIKAYGVLRDPAKRKQYDSTTRRA